MGRHENATLNGIHIPHNWVYADAATREAVTGLSATDVGKIALQSDDDSYWVLSTATPTWTPLKASGAYMGEGRAASASNQVHEFRTFSVHRVVIHSTSAWATLYVDGSSQELPSLSDGEAWYVKALVTGVTQNAAKRFAFEIDVLITNAAGTTANQFASTTTHYDTDDTSFDAQPVADDTNNLLQIRVNDGDGGGDTVVWSAVLIVSIAKYTT